MILIAIKIWNNIKQEMICQTIEVKQRLIYFINRKRDESIAAKRIVNLAHIYYLVVSSIEDYNNEYLSLKRTVVVTLMRVILFVNGLRYLISAGFPSKTMWSLMSDANYLLTNPRVFSLFCSLASFIILFIMVVVEYQELNHSFSLWQFLCEMYFHEMTFKLNKNSWNKFKLKADLLTKTVMKYLFWVLLSATSSILIGSTILAYFEPGSNFSLLAIIIWSPITVIWLILFYATSAVGFCSWYLVALYLKSKFKEITEDIKQSLKTSNSILLMKAIIEHDLVSTKLNQMNKFYNFIIFIFYYGAVPALLLLVYISHAKETTFYMRIITLLIVFLLYGGVTMMNLISAMVAHSAHKPYPILFRYFVGKRHSLRHKLKIILFIERLTSPQIAFYCLDFYPMNSYEFYRLVCYAFLLYLLILKYV